MRRARIQRRGRSPGVATFGAGVLSLASGSLLASPTGGQVTAGNGQITQNGNQTTITQQSQNLAINWQSFNIGANQGVTFNQPGATSIALNEVVGQSASQILGSLKANGQVFILNPNGVLFGSGAQVSVGGLVAGTLGLNVSDFLAGKYDFFGNSNATVSNAGTLTAANGGYIALLGAQVSNTGSLSAPLGNVSLAAGQQITLQLANGSLLGLTVNQGALNALASNQGLIRANGGQVLLTAEGADSLTKAVVNNSGVIEAQALDYHNGTIQLLGDMNSGTVNVSGTLDASNTAGGTGGEIDVFGSQVNLLRDAKLSANGTAGGGTIHVGGDFHGAVAAENATSTYVAKGVSIDANAIENGTGGQVSVWSNEQTYFYGNISATGGAQGGNGGFVETSGKNYLDFQGTVDLLAAHGTTGTLLLDPYSITIDDTASSPITGTGSNPETFTSGSDSDISSSTLNAALASSNVLIQTGTAPGGSITVATSAAPLSWTTSNTLALSASANIAINSPISGVNGTLELVSSGGSITQTAPITVASLAASASGGSVTLTNSNNAISTIAGASGSAGFSLSSLNSLVVGSIASVVNSGSNTTGITSPNGTVTLTSSGSVSTATGATVSGTTLTLQTAGGIGSQASPLATAVQNVSATNSGGADIAISNTASGLTVGTVNQSSGGNIFLKNSGTLTTSGTISSTATAGNLVLSAGSTLAVDSPINVDGTVDLEAGTGNISQLTTAGDSITAQALAANATHGTVSLTNTANSTPVFAGTSLGNLAFIDSTSLTLQSIAAVGTGTITGAGGTGVKSTSTGNIGLATTGNFTNSIGASALSVASGHRWLVYSTNPANDSDNGLIENWQQYNAPISTTPASSTGNGFLYSLAPTLTVTLTGTIDKTYNASTTAPVVQGNYSISGQLNGDTVVLSDTSATYSTANVGTGEAITVNGLAVSSASNGSIKVYGYRVASGSTTVSGNIGEIDPASLTITPATATKTYDSTTSVANGGTLVATGLQGSDSVTGTESFTSANVLGTNGSTLVVNSGYTVNDGNNGQNYTVTIHNATGTITPATVTLAAVTDTKVYDITTSAAGTTVSVSGLQGSSDSVTGTSESFTSPNVKGANGSTLTVNSGYTVNDGNNGNNYTVVLQSAHGTITPAPLTLTTQSDTKVYDSTTSASGTAVGVSGLLGSDSISGDVESFTSKNVLGTNGSTLTVAPGYAISDGNNGHNYAVTVVNSTGTITPATLTLGAVTDTKTYDATTNASGTTVTIAGLQGSDTVTGLTESFGSKNVMGANGSTLSVNNGYTINDGNSGNNYAVTTNTATGTINPAALTLSAATDSKTYDGTTSATGTTVGISGLQGADTVTSLTESFDSKNVMGTNGSTLSVNTGYAINDGNAGNNYAVTMDTATGTISPAPLTITANSASKAAYSANPAFTATYVGLVGADTPTSLSGTLAYTTSATTKSPQGNYAIVPSGVSSSNYTIDFVDGILTIVPGTVTAAIEPGGPYDSALTPTDGLLNGSTPPSVQPAGPWLTIKGSGVALPAGVSEVE